MRRYKWNESELIYKESLEILNIIYPKLHPNKADCLLNLGKVLERLNKFE